MRKWITALVAAMIAVAGGVIFIASPASATVTDEGCTWQWNRSIPQSHKEAKYKKTVTYYTIEHKKVRSANPWTSQELSWLATHATKVGSGADNTSEWTLNDATVNAANVNPLELPQQTWTNLPSGLGAYGGPSSSDVTYYITSVESYVTLPAGALFYQTHSGTIYLTGPNSNTDFSPDSAAAIFTATNPGGSWTKYGEKDVTDAPLVQGPITSMTEPDRGAYPNNPWIKDGNSKVCPTKDGAFTKSVSNPTCTTGAVLTYSGQGVTFSGAASGVTGPKTAAQATVTATPSPGHLWVGGGSEQRTVSNVALAGPLDADDPACQKAEATAAVSITPGTCDTAGSASVTGLLHATLDGTLDTTPGAHTANFTATSGYKFANGTKHLAVNYTVPPKSDSDGDGCAVKDATASVTVVQSTCDQQHQPTTPSVSFASANATTGSAPDTTPGTHSVTFTANAGHRFADGSKTKVVSYTVNAVKTQYDCAIQPPDDSREVPNGTEGCDLKGYGAGYLTWIDVYTTTYSWDEETQTYVGTETGPVVKEGSFYFKPYSDKEYVLKNCDGDVPDSKVEYTEWVDGTWECGDKTVTQTRTKTVTPYVWDLGEREWVEGTPIVTTETRTRDLTESEQFPCVVKIPVPATPSQSDPCGYGNAHWNVPADTDQIDWTLAENGHLIAATKAGYEFADGTTSHDYGVAHDSGSTCITTVPVPAVPAQTDPCGPNNAAWVVPANTASVTWTQTAGVLVASTNSGYVFTDGTTSHNYGKAVDSGVICIVEVPVPAAPSVTDECGPGNAYWNVPANTASVVWTLADGVLTASTTTGYKFADGTTSHVFGKAVDSGETCPIPPKHASFKVKKHNQCGYANDNASVTARHNIESIVKSHPRRGVWIFKATAKQGALFSNGTRHMTKTVRITGGKPCHQPPHNPPHTGLRLGSGVVLGKL